MKRLLKRHPAYHLLTCCVVVLLLNGCNQTKPTHSSASKAQREQLNNQSLEQANNGKPESSQDQAVETALNSFALELEKSLNQAPDTAAETLLSHFDLTAFANHTNKPQNPRMASSNKPLNKSLVKNILRAFVGREAEFRFSQVKNFHSTEQLLLKIRAQRGEETESRMQFYLLQLNYQAGDFAIKDIISLRFGQALSDEYSFSQLRYQPDYYAQTRAFFSDAETGEQVLENYQALPFVLKRHPVAIAHLLKTATLYNYDYLYEVLYRLEPQLKTQPQYSYALMNLMYSGNMYKEAAAALVPFNETYGDDSYIEIIKSYIAEKRNQLDKALFHLEKAIDIDPADEEPYNALLNYFMNAQNYADAVLVVDVLTEYFGYNFLKPAVAEDEYYQPLISSTEFKQWQIQHTSAQQDSDTPKG